MHGSLLRHGLKSNAYTPQQPLHMHQYRSPRSVMQQKQQYYLWKRSPALIVCQQERPHSDDFLFFVDNNRRPPLLSVLFPRCKATPKKVHLYDIKPSPLSLTVAPFSSIYYRDPLVTTSKTPLVVSGNMDKKTNRNGIHAGPGRAQHDDYAPVVIYQHTYVDQQKLSSPVHLCQSRPQQRHQDIHFVPHHQQLSTISHRSSHQGTAPPSSLDNHSPPTSYHDHSTVGNNGRHICSIYQKQHRYQDFNIDNAYSDRRISNNTYTSTSTRSSSAPRRFSSSSTSSKSTLASSMESISNWNSHDYTSNIDMKNQDGFNSLPIDDAQTTIVNKSTNTGSVDDDQQQTLSSSRCIPIWADPIKVRDNPTRYKVVQDYMTKHQIPNASPLPLHHSIVFYASEGTTTTNNYRSRLQRLFTSETMWNFCLDWKQHKDKYAPSRLAIHQTIYCFRKGVEPMWEDKVNKKGGRLTLVLMNTLSDTLFDWLVCSFIGGNLVLNGCVGLVFSKRARADRIELWLDASSGHHDRIDSLRAQLLGLIPAEYHPLILNSRYKKHYGD